jgi:hypothetical protein
VPQELQQLPPNNGPVLVDITHLINLQQQADEDDSSSSSGDGGQRWKKKSSVQKQLELLDRTGLQRLLWVTIHQPGGGSNAATVFVKPWPAALDADALWFRDGPSGQVSVLLELQQRPDVGQQPMAVVEKLRFAPAAAVDSSSSSSSSCAGIREAGDSSSNSCAGSKEAGESSSSSISCAGSKEAGDSSSSSSSSAGSEEAGDSSSSSSAGSEEAGDSSSSSGGVYDYLVLCCGDFSPLEHENMFPNAMVHCGDGRQLHSARVSSIQKGDSSKAQ